jgi:hypothetical protein
MQYGHLGRASQTNDHAAEPIKSLIPARLDRLGWSRLHTMLVVALGVAWVLDGLEITIASNVTTLISKPQSLNLSSGDVGFAVGTVYLSGQVAGALFFGRLSDKWGRRRLFMITLGVYLFGGLLTALTFGHSQGWVYWLWISPCRRSRTPRALGHPRRVPPREHHCHGRLAPDT